MKKNSIIIIIALILILGIFIGRCSKPAPLDQKKPLYWTDTMQPSVHYPGPGKSSMGMELIPVYPNEEIAQSGIYISPAVTNNLGIRSEPVEQGTLSRNIETIGYIEPNENNISHVHSYADGWIKKLFVKAVGDPVKKDQVLLGLYSPMLVSAQEEYLIALESKSQTLIDASLKKLQALNIPESQIQQLKSSQQSSQLINILSPQDGVVAALNVREGMRVTSETEIMSIVDLTNIWMIAQIFESQANWVKVGERAEATVSAFPTKVWKGEVEYVYPQVDPITRTLKVRFRFNNSDDVLKPNMYATIFLFAEPKSKVMNIPLDALIQSSEGNRVIVSLGNGRFEVRPITTGIESGERIEVLSGLRLGEQVVTSGQFLIDSEANLKSGLQRIETPSKSTNLPNSSQKAEIVIEGKGTIKEINLSQSSLTLQHEAIPLLSWPAMTMNFSVDKKIKLDEFKVGDPVKFTFRKDEKNYYVITNIKKVSS